MVGDLRKDKKALMAASPITNLDALTTPHLIFHGARDEVVDAEQTELLEKAMKKNSITPNVRLLERTGHDFGELSDHTYFHEETLEHLNKWRTTTSDTQAGD